MDLATPLPAVNSRHWIVIMSVLRVNRSLLFPLHKARPAVLLSSITSMSMAATTSPTSATSPSLDSLSSQIVGLENQVKLLKSLLSSKNDLQNHETGTCHYMRT